MTVGDHTRMLFDLGQGLPLSTAEGTSFSLRKAAAWLGLPVSVLKLLRAKGHFEVRHIANPTASYHELDLVALRDKLLGFCSNCPVTSTDGCVTLAEVMRMKAGTPQIKAAFIAAIGDGVVEPIGTEGGGLADLVFSRAEVDAFMLNRKTSHFGSTTVVAAAKSLHCDPSTVKNLCRDGLLACVQKARGLFVLNEALEKFSEKYISCAAIASRCGTNSHRIIRLCEENQIDLVWFPRSENQRPQPFVERPNENYFLG